MRKEISAILDNKTWTLMPPPRCAHIISSRWTYKVKKLADSVVNRLKARFVVQGCSKIHGVDYDKTYTPVVHLKTLQMVLAYALLHKLDVHQMDVTTTFLHARIDGEVYICQPKGFMSINHPDGSVSSTRASMDSNRPPYSGDPCIYVGQANNRITIISVYVDDCLIIAHPNNIPTIKLILSNRFTMKDLSIATSILSIKINYDQENGKMQLQQHRQINNLLLTFNMASCNPTATPMEAGLNLKMGSPINPSLPYQ